MLYVFCDCIYLSEGCCIIFEKVGNIDDVKFVVHCCDTYRVMSHSCVISVVVCSHENLIFDAFIVVVQNN